MRTASFVLPARRPALPRRPRAFAATFVLSMAGLGVAFATTVARPANGQTGAGVAGASAASSSSASVAPRLLPRLGDLSLPAEPSPLPTPAEWKAAVAIRADRPLPKGCGAEIVREHVRVTCAYTGAWIGQVAGPATGFVGFLPPLPKDGSSGTFPRLSQVQFSVRKGEPRLIEMGVAIPAYEGFGSGVDFYLSVEWREGESPTLVPQREHHDDDRAW